jgi:ribose transport system substrate-binding protein
LTRINKKLIGLALIAAVAAIALAACGGGGGSSSTSETTPSESSEPASSESEGFPVEKAAFANATDAEPLFVELKEGVVEAGEKVGLEVETYDNQADAQQTLSNAKLIAASGVEYAMEWNAVSTVSKSVEQVFSNAGVQCIAVNTPGAGGCSWFNLYNNEMCGDMGKALGTIAEEKEWTGSDTEVILVNAAEFGPEVNDCMGYFYTELQEFLPGLARIKEPSEIELDTTSIGDTTIQVNGKSLREESYNVVKTALQSIPKEKHIILYTVGDPSTEGAFLASEARRAGCRHDHLGDWRRRLFVEGTPRQPILGGRGKRLLPPVGRVYGRDDQGDGRRS